jgi:hypothetical protein
MKEIERESDTVQEWIFDDMFFRFFPSLRAARRAPLKIVLCSAHCPKGFVRAEKTFGLYVVVVP